MSPPQATERATHVREEILEPLRRVLGWLASLRDGAGRIVCPEHELEHTGKSAGAIVIALELLRLDPRADAPALRSLAIQQGRRLVANLVREGTSPCHTFRPGWHDPFNCSNSIIDGGACSDALAELVRRLGPELDPADAQRFREASLLHARTYLRYAVLDKGIPAQRAWGLTGLAGAIALAPDAELERVAIEAVGALEAIQHPDGSYPYHPLEWGAEHPGASDVSSFYQSRVSGFLLHSLTRIGRDPAGALFHAPLRRGLDFLCALQGPDGIKCGLVEAKPWYWGATYEVASHPFDVHALALGHEHFGRPLYALAAVRAFRAWVEHLGADGKPASHRPGHGRARSYQCPLFWAAHAMWLARAAQALERCMARAPEPASLSSGIDIAVQFFPAAQLARLEDGAVVAWVRGARPPCNAHHGSPHGAGLLRVLRKSDHAELVARCRLGGRQEAEWSGTHGHFSAARAWRSGARELRFSLWLARVHLRAGRWSEALRTPPRVLARAVLAFGHPRVSSAFETGPLVELLPDGLVLRSALAHRDGSRIPGTSLERSFRLDGSGLQVEERALAPRALQHLTYLVPSAARELRSGPGSVAYRLA